MSNNRRTFIVGMAAFAASGLSGAAANAAWPTRPVRLIVPYSPGGTSDIIARAVSQPLAQALGQPVLVENRPGANGNTAADMVAKSTDGHTFMLGDLTGLAIMPSLFPKLPFDLNKDFRGVAMLAYSPFLLVAHPSVKVSGLKELVALSQKEKVDFAVSAIGSGTHLAGVSVEKATGAKWQYIPYKGGAQAITDIVGGQVQVMMLGMLATLPYVQSGRLLALGVSKSTRVPLLPNVLTLAEQGMSGFEAGTWQGVLSPSAVQSAVVQRLSAELIRIIRSPQVRERLVAQGAEVSTMRPAEVDTFFARERKSWAEVVRQGGVKAE